MTAAIVLDVLLGLGVAGTALVALFHPDRVSSVTVFLGFGVLLAVVWARLGAPDVALAEASLAAGVTGALMMAAVGGSTTPSPAGHARRRTLAGVGEAALAVGIGVALTAVLVPAARATQGRPTLATEATAALDDSVVEHPVTAVLLDFRSYDTLLEIVVLTVAAVVALMHLPDASLSRSLVPVDRRPQLVVAVRVLAPVLLILAAWLLFAGSSRPGGAFQAGAALTGLALLAVFAGVAPVPSGLVLRITAVFGATVFIGLAVVTAFSGVWLGLEPGWGGAVVVALEVALMVSIGVCLAMLLLTGERVGRRSESTR